MNHSINLKAGARIGAFIEKVQRGLEWRLDALLSSRKFQTAALLYRRALSGVVFVGVTGSCGKSTTKELIAAVLATKYRVHKNPGNENMPRDIAKALFTIPPGGGQCCVMEMSVAGYHGTWIDFEIPLRLVGPRIGVVTNIGSDHLSLFGSEDAIAEEKGKLIAALPKNGVAVLNADDARVLAMRDRCAGSVITYGLAASATVRAENVSSRWPERLSFTVVHDGRSQHVQTQLCGTHWVHSALAAFAVGIAVDMPLAAIAQAVEATPPFNARLSPMELPNGITFIRDDWKAPLWTVPAALQFMRDATAKRKIAIIGMISDYIGNSSRSHTKQRQRVYTAIANEALEIADRVIFIGTQASKCLNAKRHPDDDALQAFYSVAAAREYLMDTLQAGDLVLLKGCHRQERLEDVISIFTNGTGAERQSHPPLRAAPRADQPAREATATKPIRAIVGLGNTGERFHNTRHNVGFQMLDALARTWEVEWQQGGLGDVAPVERDGRTIYLVKPLTNMNNSGVVIQQLADRLGFKAEECMLVHDDIELPLGRILVRMSGGDGGHNGVRSVHEVFLTDAMPRLKIGVGKPDDKNALSKHVLGMFSAVELAVMEQSYINAAERLGKMIVATNKKQSAAHISPLSEAAGNIS